MITQNQLLLKPVHFVLYRVVMKNLLRVLFGISYKSNRSFNGHEQFIIVANHNSHMDTVAILSALPTRLLGKVHPVAAGDYFGRNRVTSFLTTFFINTLLISRNKEEGRQNPLEQMDRVIKNGRSILIFPEGSRGQADVMQEFKHGASILLKKNPHLHFVPIYLKGMGTALPKGDPLLMPTECQVIIGEPVLIEDISLKEIPDITAIIKASVLKLQNSEYGHVTNVPYYH